MIKPLRYITGKQVALTLTLFSAFSPSYAFNLNVNVSATIMDPPCIINGNRPISVNFGNDILISRINGYNYEKSIAYTLDCSAATSNLLKMQLKGSGATFNSALLATNKGNLGIELRSNGSKLAVNNWLNFTNPARPVLTAVLVKNAAIAPTGGVFSASSTLVVEYQ